MPVLEDLIALAGVDADAKRTADVIEHDQDVREGAGEVGELQQLRVIEQAGLRRALGNVKQATEDTLLVLADHRVSCRVGVEEASSALSCRAPADLNGDSIHITVASVF